MRRILLVEDEESLALPVKRGLEEEGYYVDHVINGDEALLTALTTTYDVIVLDWRLPGMDGITLLKSLRAAKNDTPVLMLTAMHEVEFRVEGLDTGADDFLTKPFSFQELLARLNALCRRARSQATTDEPDQTLLKMGILTMDTIRRTVTLNEEEVFLRKKEFQVLEILVRKSEEIITRTSLAELVWGSPFHISDNVIDVTISNLRRHLNEASTGNTGDVSIETVRGVGYRIAVL